VLGAEVPVDQHSFGGLRSEKECRRHEFIHCAAPRAVQDEAANTYVIEVPI